MPFTLVFEGDIRALPVNPFKTGTPFGKPVAAGIGDILREVEMLREAIDFYENAISLRAPGREQVGGVK